MTFPDFDFYDPDGQPVYAEKNKQTLGVSSEAEIKRESFEATRRILASFGNIVVYDELASGIEKYTSDTQTYPNIYGIFFYRTTKQEIPSLKTVTLAYIPPDVQDDLRINSSDLEAHGIDDDRYITGESLSLSYSQNIRPALEPLLRGRPDFKIIHSILPTDKITEMLERSDLHHTPHLLLHQILFARDEEEFMSSV